METVSFTYLGELVEDEYGWKERSNGKIMASDGTEFEVPPKYQPNIIGGGVHKTYGAYNNEELMTFYKAARYDAMVGG